MTGRAVVLALALSLLVPGGPAAAYPGDAQGNTPADTALRIGLALSGGSARGFAHVGVLRVLEREGVPVRAVSGTSMGAVVGALYAVGYGPDELETLAVERDWGALFSETERSPALWPWAPSEAERHVVSFPLRRGRPTLPTGLVTGQRVTRLLARWTWRAHPVEDFSRLPVPFVAVATDLETGEAVPLEGGFLPRALRASLAVPSIFTPVERDGRVLVDGGVARNLPAEDARRLGADLLVCSDVTEPPQPADSLGSFLDVLSQTLAFDVERRAADQRRLCDVVIRPDLDGLGTYSFDRASDWIRRGERAAEAMADTLAALARAAGGPGGTGTGGGGHAHHRRGPVGLAGRDSVHLTGIRFPGVSPRRARLLRGLLDLPVPGGTTVDRIDREVSRLYDAGLFASAVYRLDAPGEGSEAGDGPGPAPDPRGAGPRDSRGSPAGADVPRRVLAVETAPERRRELRIGARFDSHRQAAALLTVDLPRTLGVGGAGRLDLRLGEQLLFQARQTLRPASAPGLLLGGRLAYQRTPLELRDPPVPDRSRVDAAGEAVEAEFFAGRVLGRYGVVGLEVGGEWFEADFEDVGPLPDRNGWMTTAAARLTWDSRDRVASPRSGLRVDLGIETSDGLPGSDRELTRSWGDVEIHAPVADRWSLRGRVTAGATAGDPSPLHRAFFLGGAIPDFVGPRRRLSLPGIAPERLRGEALQRTELGLQFRPGGGVAVSAGWTAGDALDEWTLRPSDWTHGFALGATLTTSFGPVRLTVADATDAGGPRLALDLGGRF